VATEAELATLRERSRGAWDRADYPPLAERLMPAARELVDACAVSAGQEVLDVAAGNGNVAAAAAAEGARVVASDFSSEQVARGRARTEAESLDVEWVVAEAEDLPFEDARFDAALSVFGAMFGSRPERVASELFRVVRPGGTVGLANWPDHGFQGEFFQVMRGYQPPAPEGVPLPVAWGDDAVVRERFDGLASSISAETRHLRWEFGSFEEMGALFQRSAPRPPEPPPEDVLRAMVAEVGEVVERHNQADDGSVRIDAEYLLVVARKRG
jgi:SAM-dependent methyltransferase